MGGLTIERSLTIVGASMKPLSSNAAAMIGGRHGVKAWPSGTCVDSEATTAFSAQTGVRAPIEERPLDEAPAAFDRMMSGAARAPFLR